MRRLGILSQYLREAAKMSRLTLEEELALGERVAAGDVEARNLLVKANLLLVVSVAKRFQRQGLPIEDLVGHGNDGLLHAAGQYDYRRRLRFSTFACWWIRQHIQRALHNCRSTVRVPANICVAIPHMVRAENELTCKLGRKPTDVELGNYMGIHSRTAATIRAGNIVSQTLSLDQPDPDREDSLPLKTFLPDRRTEPKEFDIDTEAVHSALRNLPQRDRQIVAKRFGLYDEVAHTLQEVAQYFGISKQRVQQIEARCLARLRDILHPDDAL